ncbi:MAG: hypothetical protein JEZ00_15060 [Anaerolineaceae bacterium]|nr:hypothetical protein [Anaerolineaceae bacterium]
MKNNKKLFLMIVLMVILGIILSGCGKKDITGKWYETTGWFGSFDFYEDGTCIREYQNGISGRMETASYEYEFTGKTGKIFELTMFDDIVLSRDEVLDIEYNDGELTLINGNDFSMTLTKDYVEETFNEDMNNLADSAHDLLDKQFEEENGMTVEEAQATVDSAKK